MRKIVGYYMEELEARLAELKARLTGDMFADMRIREEIHHIELELNGGSCDINNPDCETCSG